MSDITVFDDTDILQFPNIDSSISEPDGLLCFGGNLSVKTLQNAYESAIFPWFSEGDPIMWWSPSKRAILKTSNIHISKNMNKLIKQNKYYTHFDTNFSQIVQLCAEKSPKRNETWITEEMQQAYIELYQAGIAHSIEVTNQQNEIIGGLYGVFIKNIFCGESMFSREANASKLALIALAKFLEKNNCSYIDCQMQTDHLASMGATEISKKIFSSKLQQLKENKLLINKNWSDLNIL